MSYFLFQGCFVAYFFAVAAYIVFFITQKSHIRRIARAIFFVAALLHTANVLARYFEAGHTPISSLHEIVSFFALSISWCYLSFRWRYTVKNFGTFASVMVFLLMVLASIASQAIIPIPPRMQTWLLPAHASIAIVADAFLALAAIGGSMYLLQERELKQKRFGFFFSRLPSLDVLDKLNNHCISIGFPLMTLGMITGYIWARQIWGGRNWHWDPKIIWSMITWLLYAGLMHQRFTVGWRGKRAALMTIVAFGAVLLTLFFQVTGASGHGG